MAIYTRRGDAGETSLVDGSRIPKADPRVEAYGTVDEANSAVGLALAHADDELLERVLAFVQQRLYDCSSHIATPPDARDRSTPDIEPAAVDFLERAVDRFESETGPLDHFIIPGGAPLAASLHVARTVVRRAERRVIALDPACDHDREVSRFLNRLSDCLFAAARYALHVHGIAEEKWRPGATPPEL